MNAPAIVTLTPRGVELGRRLTDKLGRGEVLPLGEAVRGRLTELFQAKRPLVCVMALGIVVRILGPLAQDKESDPPVVVVDEAGRFAISVLGGHVAGANELARQVADALGAVPVITTASDALGLPALDLIGREWGWKIERKENLTRVAGAMIRGERIAVYQQSGQRDWWQVFGGWPASFQRVESLPAGEWAGALIISDVQPADVVEHATVIYRPPTLVLGVGCRRGVPADEIDAMFQQVCQARGFAPLSLGVVATVDLKADEPGLVEFAANHGVPLRTFRRDELAAVADLPTPSDKVREKIGIAGVAEPAALLAAGATTLVMPKQRGGRITMALARREEA